MGNMWASVYGILPNMRKRIDVSSGIVSLAVLTAVVCAGCASFDGSGHPDSSGPEWEDVFNRDLSNAVLAGGPCTNGLWAWGADGCLTPHTGDTLLSKKS